MSGVADVLAAAADLLERDGWCQGHLHDDAGRRCIRGAISAAAFDLAPEGGRRAFRVAASSSVRQIIGMPLVEWNDAQGRTAADVIAALRDAETVA
jgi:hypothetical protein